MFLPIGDTPNPRDFTPYVNYGLLTANIGVFALVALPLMAQPVAASDPALQQYLRELLRQHPGAELHSVTTALAHISTYDLFVAKWGYRPGSLSITTLFTSMFLHGGWLHLIGNMLFLWIYGDNVEHRLGRLGYLATYLTTGVVATLSFDVLTSAQVPLVGASGAISGVLGLYFLWFPRNRVRVFVLLFPFFFDVFLINARFVLGFYLVVDNLIPFVARGAQSTGGGVAHGAHIGGFVCGLAAAWLLSRWSTFRERRRTTRGGRRLGAQPEARSTSKTEQTVLDAYERGDLGTAVLAYLDLAAQQRRMVPAEFVAELGDWLARAGEVDGALAVYRRGLVDHPRGPGVDRLLLGIGLALLHGKRRPTAAYQYLLDVLDVDPDPALAAAARSALAEIDGDRR